MKRRDFIKLSLATSSMIMLPTFGYAKEFDASKINFSSTKYSNNAAQTIIVFLYGGACQLGGNLTNIDEIDRYSLTKYNDYFDRITPTANHFWKEAGGSYMEDLISSGDMTIYRSCYSKIRDEADIRSHGTCVEQNQKGSFDTDCSGMVTKIASILNYNEVIHPDTLLPFITMEGDSKFYQDIDISLPAYLKPVGIDQNFKNPYDRELTRWLYCTDDEENNNGCTEISSNYTPKLTLDMDDISQKHNQPSQIKDDFTERDKLSSFINKVQQKETPDLGADAYPINVFSEQIEAAIKLLDENPDTKIITLRTGGLGGWDDHSNAKNYIQRMNDLFHSLKSAVAHLKAIGKDDTINIIVFAEFGRNVNLNSANGWDHGNLQNVFFLGGKKYFNHRGIVGETIVDNEGNNRIWLKPKNGTYWFEPFSIAATIYNLYGIENPNELTKGDYAPLNLLT